MTVSARIEAVNSDPNGALLSIFAMAASGQTANGETRVSPAASVDAIHDAIASAAREALQAQGVNVSDTEPVAIFGGVVKA